MAAALPLLTRQLSCRHLVDNLRMSRLGWRGDGDLVDGMDERGIEDCPRESVGPRVMNVVDGCDTSCRCLDGSAGPAFSTTRSMRMFKTASSKRGRSCVCVCVCVSAKYVPIQCVRPSDVGRVCGAQMLTAPLPASASRGSASSNRWWWWSWWPVCQSARRRKRGETAERGAKRAGSTSDPIGVEARDRPRRANERMTDGGSDSRRR